MLAGFDCSVLHALETWATRPRFTRSSLESGIAIGGRGTELAVCLQEEGSGLSCSIGRLSRATTGRCTQELSRLPLVQRAGHVPALSKV